MKKVHGVQVLKFIKDRKLSTEVILTTGFSQLIETKSAADLGCSAFLPKPISSFNFLAIKFLFPLFKIDNLLSSFA